MAVTRSLLLCLAACLASVGVAATAAPAHQDDRGVAQHWPIAPKRIVSLLPSLTETVCELGACDRLVGTDRHSNHPPSVRQLPKAGGLEDAGIERIVSLRPDVVLLAASARATERLQALGLKVVVLEPRTQADLRRVTAVLAAVLGLPDPEGQAEALWARMQQQVKQAAAAVPPAARGLRVYVEVDAAPYAASESSFIGETLAALGASNVVPAGLGPFPRLNGEFVVRADPQVIMLPRLQAGDLAARPGWARIEAVRARERRVCAFDPAQWDVLSRPGPRMGEAAWLMARCLQRAVEPAP